VAARIDGEIRKLIDDAHELARTILTTHRATLDELAGALVERETLDTPELMDIFGKLPVWPGRGPGRQPARRTTPPKVRVRNPLPAATRDAPAKPARRPVPRAKPATA
jgi:cell division protease FtsH